MSGTVDSILKTALESLGVPVARLLYTGKAETFIVFQLAIGTETGYADDDTDKTEYIYQVHIYSKGDYIPLLHKVKRTLKEAGFFNVVFNPEIYESETGYYHIPLEVNYLEV